MEEKKNEIPVDAQAKIAPVGKKNTAISKTIGTVRYCCSIVIMVSAIVFVVLALMSIWGVVHDDIIWRAFTSLAIIGFGALIVSAVAPLLDR